MIRRSLRSSVQVGCALHNRLTLQLRRPTLSWVYFRRHCSLIPVPGGHRTGRDVVCVHSVRYRADFGREPLTDRRSLSRKRTRSRKILLSEQRSTAPIDLNSSDSTEGAAESHKRRYS